MVAGCAALLEQMCSLGALCLFLIRLWFLLLLLLVSLPLLVLLTPLVPLPLLLLLVLLRVLLLLLLERDVVVVQVDLFALGLLQRLGLATFAGSGGHFLSSEVFGAPKSDRDGDFRCFNFRSDVRWSDGLVTRRSTDGPPYRR